MADSILRDKANRFLEKYTTDSEYINANGSDLFIKKCPACQGGVDSGRVG